VRLDLEVLQQEIGRVAVDGRYPTHLRRQHYHRGLLLGKPTLHRWTIEQIEHLAGSGKDLIVTRPFQGSADGAARHAPVADHDDAVGRGDQDGHLRRPPDWSRSGLT